jgi:GNAT superfamily N-acetyltransferase
MTPLPFESAVLERRHGDYLLSTDRARLDLDAIHGFLSGEAYWAAGVPRVLVERAVAGSLPIAAYAPDGALAGFARAVTDGALFGYLRDVFVLPAHRGRGLGKALSAALLEHPDLATVRNWMLATRDAHALYASLGFGPPTDPGMLMQKRCTPPR